MILKQRTACSRDCPDACGMIATIENGRVTRLQGDSEHPVTQGFLCHRTSRFLERQYDPNRLTMPLLRQGTEFVPITWDEALDRIAHKLKAIKAESGPAAVLNYRCGGSLGLMKCVTDYFFEVFGPTSVKSGDICAGAGDAAQHMDFGEQDSHDVFDTLNAKTIILWGKNVYVSNVHLLPILKQARQQGAKIILIDPVRHRTVDLCDSYIQPRPGGDIALALGTARQLFDTGSFDRDAATYCDHFEQFRELACSRSVSEWATAADVSSADVERLAQAYANRPCATLVGWGLQRREFGATTIRTIDAVTAISGNLGIPGGGVSFYYRRRGAFDLSFMRGNSAAPRALPESLLGPAILAASDPPIRLVWITAANPVAMLPQSQLVAEALRSREMTVVVDSFLTDTARCAHIVLPTTTMLEEEDLVGSYGHHWLASVQAVVPPLPGTKSDFHILCELARKLNLQSDFSGTAEDWKRRLLRRAAEHGVTLDRLQQGAVRSPFAPTILFAERKFSTPSGRVNLIHELPRELNRGPDSQQLLLFSLSTESAQASQWVHGEGDGLLEATVHPDAVPGRSDGDIVTIRSDIAELTVKLKFDRQQRVDVLIVPKGGWVSEGRCANVLIKARETDFGGGAVYYDTLVQVMRNGQSQ